MSAQTITVYIDSEQLKAQQDNNYSLYLAKMVNGAFTVIWQSLGPKAKGSTPGYEFSNEFDISVPSYKLNYGTVKNVQGSVTFSASGKAVDISLGQVVDLSDGGQFGTPVNGGPVGTMTVNNKLAANPHEVLCDSTGVPIFVNLSGMDLGPSVITPKDHYQVWFGNHVETGTIIADNRSAIGSILFDGIDSQTISYNNAGAWETGPLRAAYAR